MSQDDLHNKYSEGKREFIRSYSVLLYKEEYHGKREGSTRKPYKKQEQEKKLQYLQKKNQN